MPKQKQKQKLHLPYPFLNAARKHRDHAHRKASTVATELPWEQPYRGGKDGAYGTRSLGASTKSERRAISRLSSHPARLGRGATLKKIPTLNRLFSQVVKVLTNKPSGGDDSDGRKGWRAKEIDWESLLREHDVNSEYQIRRFLRSKEDYANFLRKSGPFEEMSLGGLLKKRGTCTCPLSNQTCGAMDPFKYRVHCRECSAELPPFSDQMVAMSRAIGDPCDENAHRNARSLDREEENRVLLAQKVAFEGIIN